MSNIPDDAISYRIAAVVKCSTCEGTRSVGEPGCWPSDGHWPCVTRMETDEAAGSTTDRLEGRP